MATLETYYEDKDYLRYLALYGDVTLTAIEDASTGDDPEELLLNDEISGGEEGFLQGYRRA